MKRLAILVVFLASVCVAAEKEEGGKPVCISGIYPHLAAFNQPGKNAEGALKQSGGECGIGAIVPWAGKLWMVTYSPHCPNGSVDKLYAIGEDLSVEVRPESVGGTPANRMIHRESNQLIIGPYFIDEKGNVRVVPPAKMPGRLTATARHLTDGKNKVYFYDMEGMLYEVDVHTLAVSRLFKKPVPGWHGKGAYTAQGRLVVANNGETAHGKLDLKVKDLPKSEENAGVLAEWNGTDWKIIERRQFTDVTGPNGIYGSSGDHDPLWAIGWDKRSVILKLLDGGQWYTYRLPKASNAYDGKHGWYTEWPRIREVGNGKMLMDMHGMLYDFPKSFSRGNSGGLRPIASHLRYIPDFCEWKGQLVLAADDTSIMQNPMAGQSQSNLWFGSVSDLSRFGPLNAWGGPWVNDRVKANVPSDPFFIGGFEKAALHVQADSGAKFKMEIDEDGKGNWKPFRDFGSAGGQYVVFPFAAKDGFRGEWVRFIADRDCKASVVFHFSGPRYSTEGEDGIFRSVAQVGETGPMVAGLIRPASHNRNLQFVARTVGADGTIQETSYEVDETMKFVETPGGGEPVKAIAAVKPEVSIDEASVVVNFKGNRFRLPIGGSGYETQSALGPERAIRECASERLMLNAAGTLYELGREDKPLKVRPICTHNRRIMDFCTWRGLLVMAGTKPSAKPDGNYFATKDGKAGLWFGAMDDLWKLGRPVGKGGPWKNTAVKANEPSDPYLMSGFTPASMELSHDSEKTVTFRFEYDFDLTGWHRYTDIDVKPGQAFKHTFMEGFRAHWVRVSVNSDCKATAIFSYE